MFSLHRVLFVVLDTGTPATLEKASAESGRERPTDGGRLGKQMPPFGMYQPHIAQDSQSKLLHTSTAYKQFPRAKDELRPTHCRQWRRSDVLLAPTKDFKASVQITLTPLTPCLPTKANCGSKKYLQILVKQKSFGLCVLPCWKSDSHTHFQASLNLEVWAAQKSWLTRHKGPRT